LRTGLRARGPATVDREVTGGRIGWVVRREPRGVSARTASLRKDCCTGFARIVYPDPDDFLGVAIGDKTLLSFACSAAAPTRNPDGRHLRRTCQSRRVRRRLPRPRRVVRAWPARAEWGFSGAGQQSWIVSGIASDDVSRIEVFLSNGERWRAPLRDNATAFRIQRAKFPARFVAYDAAGRVIDVKTIRGGG